MNFEETKALGGWLAGAFPQQKWNDATPEVWAELLEPYSYEDGRAAAKALTLKPGQRFVAISELVEQIKLIRRKRFDGVNPEQLGASAPGDDVRAYLDAVKRDVKAIGDGVPVEAVVAGEHRPVNALLESLSRSRAIEGAIK